MEHHVAIIKQIRESRLVKSPQLVLMLLANRRQEGWRLGDIASVTGVTATMINAIKEDLVKKGWASIHSPERDLRVAKIYLTDAGRVEASRMWRALGAFAAIEASWRAAAPARFRSAARRPKPD